MGKIRGSCLYHSLALLQRLKVFLLQPGKVVYICFKAGPNHPYPSPLADSNWGGLDITELTSHTAGAVTQPVYHILIYKELFPHFTCPLWHYTFYGTTVYKHGSQEASILTKALPVFSQGLSVSFSFLLSVVIIFLSLYCSIKVYKSSRVKSFSWLMVHYLWMAAIYFVWFLLRKRKKQNKTCACRILFLLSYLLF